MKRTKKRTLLTDPLRPAAERLSAHITRFFNVAFGRHTVGSRELVGAVLDALADGYSEDEIRIAFWIARCVTGEAAWLSERLRSTLLPPVVLRHHGRLNNITGKEAMRWLDDLLARRLETNQAMMKSLWSSLPEDMKEDERELLARMGVTIDR
jgi:hypothetical protein